MEMRTRPVRADELDLFIEAGGHPDHREEVRQYLEDMLAAGSMRPEWCFVAEVENRYLVGRAALWTLPGMNEPLALVLLDVSWEDDRLTVGKDLLEDVLAHADLCAAEEIEHVLDSPAMPPQFQYYPERRAHLLEAAGFALRRETDRFEWRGEEPPGDPERLSFRTLEEVGEEEFVGAIERVSEGTLDGGVRADRERLGAEHAARQFYVDACRMAYEPSWWRLAYDGEAPDGELVGLVMSAEAPAFLTIFYIGVVPEMRGRGYVDDLLTAGTTTLLSTRANGGNVKPLRADTDVANAPMAAAFERAGWARFARRREYAVGLAPPSGR